MLKSLILSLPVALLASGVALAQTLCVVAYEDVSETAKQVEAKERALDTQINNKIAALNQQMDARAACQILAAIRPEIEAQQSTYDSAIYTAEFAKTRCETAHYENLTLRADLTRQKIAELKAQRAEDLELIKQDQEVLGCR